MPPILKSSRQMSRIDVIWYRPNTPFYLFEVEDGGNMRDALHRLYNAMAFNAKFFIVSPAHNRDKFETWVRTAPFTEFQDTYNFTTYTELFDFYKEAIKFTTMRERFLLW